MKRWIANKLYRLALRLGASNPPRIFIALTVRDRPMLLMTDEQAQAQAEFHSGSFSVEVGEVRLRLTVFEPMKPRR